MARLDDLPDGRAPRFDARVSFPDEIAVHVLDLGVESYDLYQFPRVVTRWGFSNRQ